MSGRKGEWEPKGSQKSIIEGLHKNVETSTERIKQLRAVSRRWKRNAANICADITRAAQIARVPGFLTQAGIRLRRPQELCQDWDFALARKITNSISHGQLNSSGQRIRISIRLPAGDP